MRKTVLVAFVKLLFCFTASAQTNSDSANRMLNLPLFKSDSLQQRPLFLAPVLPANFYANHLPFFCSTELKLQKVLKFPVKFRLGSVEYCDRLEGKLHQ